MIIGVTGGVGCGKSTVMDMLEKDFGMTVIQADKVGHEVMLRKNAAYEQIIGQFGREIIDVETKEIDRQKLAGQVFNDKEKLRILNSIIHPVVKKEILNRIEKVKAFSKDRPFIAIEAALLLEDNYDEICDKIIYVYADEAVRRERLKESRGYSDEKIDLVMSNQMSEEEFRKRTDDFVDNSKGLDFTFASLQKIVDKYKAL